MSTITFRQFLSSALGFSGSGKRNYYDIYDYPKDLSSDVGFRIMWQLYKRTGIGNRLTSGMAKLCWRQGFELWENDKKDATQIAVDQLNLLRRSKLLQYIERADTLQRIGRYGVLFLGIPDGRQPNEEIGRVAGGEKMLDNLYYRPYAYDSIKISNFELNPISPRYGLPLEYQLTVINKDAHNATPVKTIVAHWSRIIHLNENGLESDIEGMGYLEPIVNTLYNLEKVCGGSSEAYFRNAKGKIAFEFDKEMANFFNENEPAKKAFNENAESFTNDFKDQITFSGGSAKTLDTPHYTPKDTIMGNLWIISGYSGYPIRVLTGEGSGQLAGSEDRLAMNNIVQSRQDMFGMQVAIEILERLKKCGMLSLPDYYDVRFPLQEETTEDQKVKNNEIRANTFKTVGETLSGLGGVVDTLSAFRNFGFDDIDIEAVDELPLTDEDDELPLTEDDENDSIDEQPDSNVND